MAHVLEVAIEWDDADAVAALLDRACERNDSGAAHA
jgi:hypothetical protein